MAWYSDEQYIMIQDSREKKSVAASAFKRRSHCGRGGSVKFPSDYLSKKELKAMNGECIKYASLKKPMTWDDFKKLPDDLKKEYIESLREKFNVPDKEIGEMLGVGYNTVYRWFKCLGLCKGMGSGAKTTTWNKEGWIAWLNGADPNAVKDSESPVDTGDENNEFMEIYDEESGLVLTSSNGVITKAEPATAEPDEVTAADISYGLFANHVECVDQYCQDIQETTDDETEDDNPGPIAFTGNCIPIIPKSGSMTFENNSVDDILQTLKVLLSGVKVNLKVEWDCVD